MDGAAEGATVPMRDLTLLPALNSDDILWFLPHTRFCVMAFLHSQRFKTTFADLAHVNSSMPKMSAHRVNEGYVQANS